MRLISILLVLVSFCVANASDRKERARGEGAWAWATAKTAPTPTEQPAVKPSAATAAENPDALQEVNDARKARGLAPLIHDPLLTQAAYACAKERASRGIHGHLPESDFKHLSATVSTDGVAAGCAALEPSWGWQSCCWDEPGYTHAGAAYVMSGGLRFMHIFVSNKAPTVFKTEAKSKSPVVQSAGSCASGSCGASTRERRGLFSRR